MDFKDVDWDDVKSSDFEVVNFKSERSEDATVDDISDMEFMQT